MARHVPDRTADVSDDAATSPHLLRGGARNRLPRSGRRRDRAHHALSGPSTRRQDFRLGRAFLAGDAAHINNPLGGMGMNADPRRGQSHRSPIPHLARRVRGSRTRPLRPPTPASHAGIRPETYDPEQAQPRGAGSNRPRPLPQRDANHAVRYAEDTRLPGTGFDDREP